MNDLMSLNFNDTIELAEFEAHNDESLECLYNDISEPDCINDCDCADNCD